QPKGFADLAMKILMWIHIAFRPLQLNELGHALAVERDQTNLEKDNIPSQSTMLKSCCGLVIVDTETSSVRFIHYTLQEFLQNKTDTYFPDRFSQAAITCLTYLNFEDL